MTDLPSTPRHPDAIRASVELRLGPVFHFGARMRTTPAGVLSTGAMVAAILLSTAAIVRAARSR